MFPPSLLARVPWLFDYSNIVISLECAFEYSCFETENIFNIFEYGSLANIRLQQLKIAIQQQINAFAFDTSS